MMKASELREKSFADLQAELVELRKAQFKSRLQKVTGVENIKPHHNRQYRKDIARIKMVMAEKQKDGEKA